MFLATKTPLFSLLATELALMAFPCSAQKPKPLRLTPAQQIAAAKADADRANKLLYDANMALIQFHARDDNSAKMVQLLEETRSLGSGEFEWGYWNRELHKATWAFNGGVQTIASMAFSRDSKRLLVGGRDEAKL